MQRGLGKTGPLDQIDQRERPAAPGARLEHTEDAIHDRRATLSSRVAHAAIILHSP
jgi:hypothetical protein